MAVKLSLGYETWSLKRTISQIPHCTCPISHNAPFRTEMCTFLFWMVHCGIWNRCIVGFVRFHYFLPTIPLSGSLSGVHPTAFRTKDYNGFRYVNSGQITGLWFCRKQRPVIWPHGSGKFSVMHLAGINSLYWFVKILIGKYLESIEI